jgi:hypothetical protein
MRSLVLLALAATLAQPVAVAPATAAPALGTIKGRVVYDGTPPARAAVDRSQDEVCAKNKTPADDLIVNAKTKGVKDVLVRLPVGAAPGAKPPKTPVIVDQRGCTYLPHVVGMMAGQDLTIRNSDRTMHNVHTYAGDETLFNVGQPAGGKDIRQDPGVAAGNVIRLACDVHPWMEAFAVVSDHPYFVVTGDDGSFTLHAPPGKYELEAWHPKLGVQKVDVTVTSGKTSTATFTFK